MAFDAEPIHSVRFAPSKAVGLPDVDEVAVFHDRLEVRTRGQWRVFRLQDIADAEARRRRYLPVPARRRQVAELFYARESYTDSYFRFFTEPRLTVYMPDDGQPLSPHSVFSRVLAVLTRGGYTTADPNPAGHRYNDRVSRRPLWLRKFARVSLFVAAINFLLFLGAGCYLGGATALEGRVDNGRYIVATRHGYPPQTWSWDRFFKRRPRPPKGYYEWEVSQPLWVFSYVTTLLTWGGIPVALLLHVLAYSFPTER